MSGTIPEWMLSATVAVTLFTVMFGLGLGIAPGELRWIWRSPGPMVRGLFAVLVAVPALALAVSRSLGLPPLAEIGIMLMAISPGAPVALRRSFDAGGHRAFAPSLQIAVVLLAVVSMPLSIAVLDALYGTRASISPWDVARQVLVAQLLPLGLGIALRQVRAPLAERIEPRVTRLGTLMLMATVLLVLIDAWQVTVTAGFRGLAAILLVIYGGLALGHLLGGPDPAMRTAVAISCAARNGGLALLVATQNHAPPEVNAAILAYLLVSVFAIAPYVTWRRRAGARAS
ncbi:MAG TPA: bile acid:sodium symporter [Burkholderiales bacterium]|nr:bile acid:sodium symporter [Burkholderiales bacterium]